MYGEYVQSVVYAEEEFQFSRVITGRSRRHAVDDC